MITFPIAHAHNRLSSLLKQVQKDPILLTRRGKAVGVIISPEEYERLLYINKSTLQSRFPLQG